MIGEIIDSILQPTEDYIYGFANLHGIIPEKFGNFYYGVSIGKKLDDEIINKNINGPTIEYYNHYNEINKDLTHISLKLKREFSSAGVESIAIEPTVSTDSKEYFNNPDNLTTDISHKMVATRAGLGWIGKTDLFVSKKFGTRLRLVSLLINKSPGIYAKPIDKSRCGICNICVDKCPAKAANGILWNTNIHRDEFFDAQKCRDKCGEMAKVKLNIDKRICGICVAVCPIGNKKNNN